MEEKMLNMEYVINGEKYLITATKVTDNEENINSVTIDDIIDDIELVDDNEDTPEYQDVMIINLDDIPDCLTISDWLSIIDNYNVMILK